jgi:ammonia channel protein AmtB
LEPWSALLTGAISGILYLWSSNILIQLKLDDVVDAVPVHLVNGLWGVLAAGLLSSPERMLQAYGNEKHAGLFYALSRGTADANLLGCQVIGALFIMGWAAGTMLPFFLLLNYFGWLRSEAVEELVGLDVCYNGEDIYAGSKAGSGDEENEIRGEYMDAYEEYRKSKKREEEERAKRAKVPSVGTNDSSSGRREENPFFDETTSV